MQKHIQHNKYEQKQFFRKIYLSLYSKGFERVTKGIIMWEVSWRLNRTATYWPPLFWLLQHFFPVLLGCATGDLEAQSCWDMALIPASSLQLIDFLSHPGYIILLRTPASCSVTIRTQFNPSTVKVIPPISSTRWTCYLHRCISSFDSLAGVNMLHGRYSGWSRTY